jgi:hypothetical protein
MKKTLAFLIFLHLTFFSVAQISFGVKGGGTFSNIAYKNVPDEISMVDRKSRVSFHGGVYAEIQLAGKLSFIPELQFTGRGYTINHNLPNRETRVNINYLELPLLLSYSPIKRVAIDLGPNISYMISVNAGSQFIEDSYKKELDAGLTGGVRVKVTEKIAILARYYYALTTLDEMQMRDENNNSLGILKSYNRSTQFGISYKVR